MNEDGMDSPVVVVKVQTSYWSDKNGMYAKKSFIFRKRLCRGFNFVEEDLSCVGAEDTISRIANIDRYESGLYQLIMVNQHVDYESGYVDDWEYRLVPYEEKGEKVK